MFLAVGPQPGGRVRSCAAACAAASPCSSCIAGCVGALTALRAGDRAGDQRPGRRSSRQRPGLARRLQRNDRVQDLDDKYDVIQRVRDYVEKGDFGQQRLRRRARRRPGRAVRAHQRVHRPGADALLPGLAARRSRTRALPPRAGLASRRGSPSSATGSSAPSAATSPAPFFVAVCAGISTADLPFIVGLGEYAFALAFVVGLLVVIPMIGAVISRHPDQRHRLRLTDLPDRGAGLPDLLPGLPAARELRDLPAGHVPHGRHPGRGHRVAALAGAALLGVIGALLAIPTAAALLMLTREVFIRRQDTR